MTQTATPRKDDRLIDDKETRLRLLRYLKPHLPVLIGGLACAAMTASITVGIAKFIELALDAMRSGNIEKMTWMCISVVAVFFTHSLARGSPRPTSTRQPAT